MDHSVESDIIEEVLEHLEQTERECLHRYVGTLRNSLRTNLLEVHLYGSFARGDAWNSSSPMHSDIDLLVLCSEQPSETQIAELINVTYRLFLECGRQISPFCQTMEAFENPKTRIGHDFKERLREEGRQLFLLDERNSAI